MEKKVIPKLFLGLGACDEIGTSNNSTASPLSTYREKTRESLSAARLAHLFR